MTQAREEELAELLEEVHRIEVQSRRLVADLISGGYSSVFRGSGIEFDEVRDYVPGDDPRSIDWNVTARAGRPFIKKYVDERELTVMFLLDLGGSMDAGWGRWSGRQAAARLAGCLALSAVRCDDKVGLIAASTGVDRYVPPGKGSAHALRIIRDCLVLRGAAPVSDLRPALEMTSRVLRRHAVVFLLSDFLSTGWEDALSLCARRHDLIAVRLTGPEVEPPAAGLLRLRDPGSGRTRVVDWADAGVREAYREAQATWRSDTEESLRRAGVDLMEVPIPTAPDRDAIARPLQAFFRMRERRGAKR